jgi:hypothetical protein
MFVLLVKVMKLPVQAALYNQIGMNLKLTVIAWMDFLMIKVLNAKVVDY